MNGILLIDKDSEMTSRDVVNHISHKFKIKKVGHTGTLDPLATGVLVICIGKATKLVDVLQSMTKEYIADGILGLLTDTLDITGNVLKDEPFDISLGDFKEILNNMIGSYEQEVPIYAAVKVNGKKLYEYARNNEKVILPKRNVNIQEIELLSFEKIDDKVHFKLRVLVSKGTYIRSLINDIAQKCQTYGTMSALRRIKQGSFDISQCCKLQDIDNGNYQLLNIRDVLKDIPFIIVDEHLANEINNGKILVDSYGYEKVGFMDCKGREIGIYQKDGKYIKPWKMLLINKESD